MRKTWLRISTQSKALRARKHLSSVIRNRVLFTPGLWKILSLVFSQSRIIFPISCMQQKVQRMSLINSIYCSFWSLTESTLQTMWCCYHKEELQNTVSVNASLAIARDQLEPFDKIKIKTKKKIQIAEVTECALIKELVTWRMKGY